MIFSIILTCMAFLMVLGAVMNVISVFTEDQQMFIISIIIFATAVTFSLLLIGVELTFRAFGGSIYGV